MSCHHETETKKFLHWLQSSNLCFIKEQIQERKKLSVRVFEDELEEFPVKEIKISNERYDKIRKEARRKWILREIKRRNQKSLDTYSLATTID